MVESNKKSNQIPLILPVEPAISRDDLLEGSSNQLAVDLIDAWPNWPSNAVILAGPIGSGKTHLATVWAQMSGAKTLTMSELENHQASGQSCNLVLEDVEVGKINENALFHIFNHTKAHGKSMLITSRSFPSAWMVKVPDLASRLKLAHVIELHEPDDTLLAGLIFKLFADRQLAVAPTVVNYLVSRMERSMEVAGKLVEWMDREALSSHRKINRKLASDALENLEQV